MNKLNKITLPTIAPTTERIKPRNNRKFLKGWSINDTFSNWNTKHPKTELHNLKDIDSPHTPLDSVPSRPESKSQLAAGLTLAEYFRTRANTETNDYSETYDVPEEEILPYLKQNFDIHETDEEGYSDSETSIRIPLANHKRRREPSNADNSQFIKVKTDYDQQNYLQCVNPSPYLKKNSVINRSKDRIQHMQQSFDLKGKSRNRALSNQPSRKSKPSEGSRKKTMLQRVKQDKVRASQLRSIDVDLVMKYANKFNLDGKGCNDMMRPP